MKSGWTKNCQQTDLQEIKKPVNHIICRLVNLTVCYISRDDWIRGAPQTVWIH